MPEDTVLKEMQEQKAVNSQRVQSEIDSAVVEQRRGMNNGGAQLENTLFL